MRHFYFHGDTIATTRAMILAELEKNERVAGGVGGTFHRLLVIHN